MKEVQTFHRLPTPPSYARRDSPTYEPYEDERRSGQCCQCVCVCVGVGVHIRKIFSCLEAQPFYPQFDTPGLTVRMGT